jgi:hypothetical protein
MRTAIRSAWVLIPCVAAVACGTAGRDWQEGLFVTPVPPDTVYVAASRALASVGQVTHSDITSRSVNGECEAKVIAAITVTEQAPKGSVVSIKSKMDVAPNMLGGEHGKRKRCIDSVASQLNGHGVPLTPKQ